MKSIDWHLKCESCGFEFSVIFNANETEENKAIIKECPCGCTMTVTKERLIGE